MTTTNIELNFPKSETRLAGFPYGVSVYKQQVASLISFDDVTIIKFPNQIEGVASSFVQGFFSEIIKAIGYKEINQKIIIQTGSEKLTESIKKNIY